MGSFPKKSASIDFALILPFFPLILNSNDFPFANEDKIALEIAMDGNVIGSAYFTSNIWDAVTSNEDIQLANVEVTPTKDGIYVSGTTAATYSIVSMSGATVANGTVSGDGEDNETAISNAERAVLANEAGADVLLRIHANGSEDPAAAGALALVPSSENVYVGALADESARLAETVLTSYCAATGIFCRSGRRP